MIEYNYVCNQCQNINHTLICEKCGSSDGKYIDPHPISSSIRAIFTIGIIIFVLLCFVVSPVTIVDVGLHGAMFVRNLALQDPTYNELCTFVANDYTDTNEYMRVSYNCEDFTNDVVKNARAQGYKAGHVFIEGYSSSSPISYHSGTRYGHSIVCFETSDKGTYFLEPQLDVLFSEAEMNEMVSAGLYSVSSGNEFVKSSIISEPELDWCKLVI